MNVFHVGHAEIAETSSRSVCPARAALPHHMHHAGRLFGVPDESSADGFSSASCAGRVSVGEVDAYARGSSGASLAGTDRYSFLPLNVTSQD
jgi:hypothetical protein